MRASILLLSCSWLSSCALGWRANTSYVITDDLAPVDVSLEAWGGVALWGNKGRPMELAGTELGPFIRIRLGHVYGLGVGMNYCYGFSGTQRFVGALCGDISIDAGALNVGSFKPYIGIGNPRIGPSFAINFLPEQNERGLWPQWIKIDPTIALDTGYHFGNESSVLVVPKVGLSITFMSRTPDVIEL